MARPADTDTADDVAVHWEFAGRLWRPAAILAIAMKLARSVLLLGVAPLAVLESARPELALYAGLYLLSGVSVGWTHRRSVRGAWAGFWGVLCVLALSAEVVGYYFFLVTGNYLDAPMLGFAAVQFGELWEVLRSEVSLVSVLLLAVPLVWIGSVYWTRPWTPRPGRSAEPPSPRWLVAGVALLALAVPPPWSVPSSAVGRAIVVELLWTAVPGRPYPEVSVARPDSWTEASLVRVEPEPAHRNVVIIWLESTGLDATSLGGKVDTTPVLEALASESLVARNAWTVVPHSTKSTIPIFCGTAPHLVTWVTEADEVPVRCLPHLLRDEGYATLMLRSATREFEGWTGVIDQIGFEEFKAAEDLDTRGFELVNYFGFEDDVMLGPAKDWLEANGDRPYLLTYMTGAPHHDYQVPTRFAKQPLSPDDEHDRYLNLVRYVDRFVGKVVALHKELGHYEDTVFVIVGDHGEAFGEHFVRQHDAVPYREVVQVPLLVHAPGAFAGGVEVVEPTSQLDIAPTVASLLGYRLDAPDREGVALPEVDADRSLKMLCWYMRRCGAVRRGDRTLVYHFDQRPSQLFDLATDPDQRVDLAADHPDEVAAMEDELLRWVAEGLVRWERGR